MTSQDTGGIFLEITEGLDSDELTESEWKVENVGGIVSSEGEEEKKVDPLHTLQKSLKEVCRDPSPTGRRGCLDDMNIVFVYLYACVCLCSCLVFTSPPSITLKISFRLTNTLTYWSWYLGLTLWWQHYPREE